MFTITFTVQLWHLITAVLVAMFITAIMTHNSWGNQSILNKICTAPFIAVCFIPYMAYMFFRHSITGVPAERFDKLLQTSPNKPKKIIGKIYLWHDKQAKRPGNKFFLVRVKRG